jgi:hypothetical protein
VGRRKVVLNEAVHSFYRLQRIEDAACELIVDNKKGRLDRSKWPFVFPNEFVICQP